MIIFQSQKDGDLKCQFEEGVLSFNLAQYLRLFTWTLSFVETVQQARRFLASSEPSKARQTVKVSSLTRESTIHYVDNQQTVQGQLDRLE